MSLGFEEEIRNNAEPISSQITISDLCTARQKSTRKTEGMVRRRSGPSTKMQKAYSCSLWNMHGHPTSNCSLLTAI